LAEAVTDAQRDALPVEVALRRIAHQAGRDLAETARRRVGEARADTARRDAVVDVLAECGYEPRRGPDGVSLVNCPFHSLARRYTDLVCGMNLDVLQGVLEGLEPTGLEALLDPAPGRCCVRLSETNGVAPGETLKAGSTSDR
jgi:predicted ArsR family transcriptional regulator